MALPRPSAVAAPALEDLDLRLGGVIIESGAPRALIAKVGGPMKAFGVGQALAPGVKIDAIAFDRVVLQSGEGVRVLTFGAPVPTVEAELARGEAREAIARVAYAEAASQGDAGLAAVVYTILNRLKDGRWGDSVETVVNAPRQFEPVTKAGGDWRALPQVSAARQARIDTILNLALEGHLPDLTKGARYFQNPAIVSERARAGAVSPHMVDFGGATPSRVIGQHAFYAEIGNR